MVNYTMDSNFSNKLNNPKPLTILASNLVFLKGNTLLHRFVLDNSDPNPSGSENYITAILRSMSDVPANAFNDDGYTALHLAVLKNNFLMVKNLLSCLASIDVDAMCKRGKGYAALHLAAKLSHLSIIQELLNRGASIDIKTTHNETALCVPVRSKNQNAINLLMEGAYICIEIPAEYSEAESDHLGGMPFLVSSSAETNFGDARRSALSYAAELGNLDTVDLLVNNGADINGEYGWCALCWALKKGNVDVVRFFLDRHAAVNVKVESSLYVLHRAINRGHLPTVEFLVRNGADVNTGNRLGKTSLHLAVFKSLEIVKFLLSNGANVNAKTEYMLTPLHYAALQRNLEILKLLVSNYADINAEDENGKTPLHLAVDCLALIENAEFLIHNGAYLEAVDVEGKTPLHTALYREDIIMVKMLVSKGASLHAKDLSGATPLHYAVCVNNLDIAAFLLEQGAVMDADFEGWTPLHAAAFGNYVEIIGMLLDSGADVEAKNRIGQTPLDVARGRNNQACIVALQNDR